MIRSSILPTMSRALLTPLTRAPRRPLCVLLVLLLSPAALAQLGSDLPRSIVEAISIGSAQRTQIDEFIASWSERAASDNPQDNKRALESLTKPLQERGVSVAFRQAYAQSVAPLMKSLDEKDAVGAKLSALRIAGDLATPNMVSRIKNAMSDEDLGVRLFAVSRAGQAFSTTATHGTAITSADATSLITEIQRVGAQDGIDHELLRACVRALSQGTRLPSRDVGDARSQSIMALSEIVGSRLQALSASDDPAFIQGLALDAASASTQSISDISATTTPQAAKAAVGLGGDIISVALRRVLGKTIEPVAQRDMAVRSVQSGETLLYFARRKAAELRGDPVTGIQTTAFADQLGKGDDRRFRDDASVLLGPGSPIVTTFGFKNDRFLH